MKRFIWDCQDKGEEHRKKNLIFASMQAILHAVIKNKKQSTIN